MTALDSDSVKAALVSKLGCKQDTTDHYRYILYDENNKIIASTKISLG